MGDFGEPWTYAHGVISQNFYSEEMTTIAKDRRIVACVNALASIPDPKAFVEAVGRLEEAMVLLMGTDGFGFHEGSQEFKEGAPFGMFSTPGEEVVWVNSEDFHELLAKGRESLADIRAAKGEG